MRLLLIGSLVVHLAAFTAFADEPASHDGSGVPDMGILHLVDDGRQVSITLKDIFDYHEHPCPGSTVAFRAMQLAVQHLWPDTVPQRKDVVILSHGSMHGVLDTFAMIARGPVLPKADAISQPSKVLEEMPVSMDSFAFTIIRRSTGEAIDLRVKSAVYPEDFFTLREKMHEEKATDAERRRLKQYQKKLIDTIPGLPQSELFEPLIQYRVLMFGA